MSLDTQPMALDELAGGPAVLDDFRVRSPAEIQLYLKKLADANVTVYLNAPDGSHYATTVWTIDAAGGNLGLAADAQDPQVQALLDADEIVAVAYLDSVKLQWDLVDVVLVRGGLSCALRCRIPREMFRFQRRNSYRVRPLPRTAPLARVRNGSLDLALRVLDVSIGGCALFYPDDAQTLAPGGLLRNVTLELDIETRLVVTLRLHHVSPLPEMHGARLGCSMVELGHDNERSLQRFIDQTQKKRRMFSLDS